MNRIESAIVVCCVCNSVYFESTGWHTCASSKRKALWSYWSPMFKVCFALKLLVFKLNCQVMHVFEYLTCFMSPAFQLFTCKFEMRGINHLSGILSFEISAYMHFWFVFLYDEATNEKRCKLLPVKIYNHVN